MTTNEPSIRWGILGCGGIAQKFAQGIAKVKTGKLLACAARSEGKASDFATRFGIERSYPSYEALLEDGEVDAVYIANTHNFHHACLMDSLRAGKAVLCEKPLTVNAAQAEEAIALARSKDLFLMEAMWTRFLPAIGQMREWLQDGVIGEVRQIRADFCINVPKNPDGRLFNRALAGGALLDLGIYPISMVSMIMGRQPESIQASATIGDTGVDEQVFALFNYGPHQMAAVSCSLVGAAANGLEIVGTEGRITIPTFFLNAKEVAWHKPNGEVTRLTLPFPDPEGFRFQIEAACRSILNGWKECPLMPRDESLAIMQTMDRVAASAGISHQT